MTDPIARQPHAALDPAGRRPKADKIIRLLDLSGAPHRTLRLLEIGTGAGVISHHLACHSGLACEVDAVDVVDQRQVSDGYRFQLVEGTALPFKDESFDAVISNHVLEHVGENEEQISHLAEMRRVMRTGAVAYLATPSRWQIVEPHFKVAFLSWLPKGLRTPYLRWRGKGSCYDCEPLSRRQLEALLSTAGFVHRNLCARAIRVMREVEPRPSLALRMAAALPEWLMQGLASFSPTHVYRLSRTPQVDPA
ncbi:MAG TPA: class I SAM-dependent methyltransferase [Xanthomonadaceae bacterium]|nr:class I SAM-dependent methyltransferase [Xanthomonadaceae bacterium]